MHILLNATSEELEPLGGDFTHYRDWLRLSRASMSFGLVPVSRARRWQGLLRRVVEKAAHTWQPERLRRRLVLLSRYLYFPPAPAASADLIFSHLLFPLGPPRGVPVVWNSQGISPPRYYEIANRGQWTVEDVAFVYRQLGRRADALVVFTEACARNVVRWCPELKEKTFVVPAPVFLETHNAGSKPSLEDGVLRLLFVGADARRKGLPEVLQAYRKLTEGHQRLQLDIVTRPPLGLEMMLANMRNARLHPSSPSVDVKRLMAGADIFLLPTHADTYALAAVEAMAHGCAVVISDLEPLPEVIPQGQVGLSVPAGNWRAVHEALARLVSDPALLREFQRNARDRYLRHHAPDVVAARLEQLFLEVKRRAQARGAGSGYCPVPSPAPGSIPTARDRHRVAVVATHPTQVLAPVYRRLAQHPSLELLVAYCSMQGAEGGIDTEFGVDVRWDVPLLDGYRWVRLPNRSPRPGVGRFFGLINPGLWRLLRRNRFDAVIAHTGYAHFSYWILLAAAKAGRTPLIFATDAWSLASRHRRRWKAWVKPLVVPCIYRVNDVVVAASSNGRDFVLGLGIPEERVALVPNVVDNERWLREAARADRGGVRACWGVPEASPVVLFCGKLQPWKRPFDLLRAFARADIPDSYLVYAGAGPLQAELEAEAAIRGIAGRARFLGFVNQSRLPSVYRAADLFVLPSEHEPFGFVLNEAMLCGCPVVASDHVGAGRDLVHPGQNGFVYPCGDVQALARVLSAVLSDRVRLRALGTAARERMETWSPRESVEAVIQAVEKAAAVTGRSGQPNADGA